jgi:hypothetical protein
MGRRKIDTAIKLWYQHMTDTNTPLFPVPKPLWEELENALMIKSKELIQDIAKTLRQESAPLWKEFRSKTKQLFLVDMNLEDEEYCCSALLCTTKVAHKCQKPTMYGKPYCPEHESYVPSVDVKNKPQVQRLKSEEPLFVDCLTQQVYNLNYERVGYMQGETCYVFEVEG